MTTCANPVTAPEAHQIPDGARRVMVAVSVDWGTDDLREPWSGEYAFCSFGCLEEWATARAVDHDGRKVVEGTQA